MYKICFVCLGNICRSPMAEFICKEMVRKKKKSHEFYIVSRGTSYEEEGNDVYPSAKRKLREEGIPFDERSATRLEKEDYEQYDYFLCMEERNVSNAIRIFEGDPKNKVITLLDRDIADPWYTGDFDITYQELQEGIQLFLSQFD